MKLGILGGGQLGRMLWEASLRQPALQPSPVYHNSAECPAARAGAAVQVGEITETSKLREFFQGVDSYIFENEFLDCDAIERALPGLMAPTPSLRGIRIAQDKLEQKKLFQRLGLPTPEFFEIPSSWQAADFSREVPLLSEKWRGLVLKTARMGYDGKGNFFVPADKAPDLVGIQEFCRKAFAQGSRVYAEPWVSFTKEVALVSCRSFAGDFGHYPLIQTEQENGVCRLAYRSLADSQHEAQAVEMARALGRELHMLGTFTIEFFITDRGDLLVNEMAPRVHNSGHFTQIAAKSSQFAMHLKAYYQKNFEADDFVCAPAFAMINLLGPEGVSGPVKKPSNISCYWYDKLTTSPGRKLGHINAQSAQAGDLPKLLQELRRQEQLWRESLTK